MELERFGKFTLLIDGIYKNIHKIKLDIAPNLGIKSVHVFWIYLLRKHPEGLTATELAALSEIDRSLVSRELSKLCAGGYIMSVGGTGKRKNYNSRHVLTEKGGELAEYIRREALAVQKKADEGINEEELATFYNVLEKLYGNFANMVKEREADFSQKSGTEEQS
jgi:DNA-binding MarR family transcriptional regulator